MRGAGAVGEEGIHGPHQVATEWSDRPPEFRPDSDQNPLIEQLRSENAYLRAELSARSQEFAAERERADVLMREALGRIEPLTAGGPELRTESVRNPSDAEQDANDVEPEPDTSWWRRWWRSLTEGGPQR